MADVLSEQQLQELARIGAQARLAQIDMEIQGIKAAFPDVETRRPGRPPRAASAHEESAAPAKSNGRKPYRMSKANREAARERMRAYWARKRQEKAVAEDRPRRAARGGKRRGRAAR